ncbi:MAG: DUF4330 domain-containing protein [Clostridia bacterium]|nr:DUF4330 domain-containing protein [Clostridia bacterium]
MAIKLKRTKKGFNGMDLFFILLIAALIVGAVFLYRNVNKNSDTAKAETVTIEYTLEFRRLENDVKIAVDAGDAVRDPDNKQTIGTVAYPPQVMPYSEIAYNYNDGNVYMAENPDLSDLSITIRAEATHSDSGYYVNGTRFLVGKAANIWTAGFAGSGYCISIREID